MVFRGYDGYHGAMSWSDDIRCLYCDGRLPLYRKITNGQFCSTAHRKAYWKEQERLAVERLHQTHDTLQAYRASANQDVDSIIGVVPITEPEPIPAPLPALEQRPWWISLVNTGTIPMGTFFPSPLSTQPQWPQDGLAGAEPAPLDYSKIVRRPFYACRLFDCGFDLATPAALALTAAQANVQAISLALVPIRAVVHPIVRLDVELQPVYEAVEIVEEQIPAFAGLLALARAVSRDAWHALAVAEPLEIVLRPRLPLDQGESRYAWAPAQLLSAGLRPLAIQQIAMALACPGEAPRAFDLRIGTEAPFLHLLLTPAIPPRLRLAPGRHFALTARNSIAAPLTPEAQTLGSRSAVLPPTPAVPPRLRLAPGCRYAVTTPNSVATPIPPALQMFASELPAIILPPRTVKVLRGAPSARPAPVEEPNPAGLLALPMLAQAAACAIEMHAAPQALLAPQMPRPNVIRPRARLEAQRIAFDPDGAPLPLPEAEPPRPRGFAPLVDFWHRAPRDLKMLGFGIPLLLALALHPRLPKVRVAAPTGAATIQRNFEKAWNTELVNVKQSVTERAAIALDEDFRAGLDDWVSRGDAPTAWSFDATGFVLPGPLALYRPSMSLGDYEMQFLGMIDKKALSWVVRASDFNNFYVIKLVVLKAGPLPQIGVTRYAVVNGKADSRVDTVVPIDAREDTLYRVRLDVHGDEFVLNVQDQLVDAWSEPRLRHGGIGFFTSRGEQSRLRWVQVTHQYDMLGRVCAYLAPYNVAQATSGSWEQ